MTLTWWSHKHFQLETRPSPGFCDHGCCKTQRKDKQRWVHTHTNTWQEEDISCYTHTHTHTTLWAAACGCILWSEIGNCSFPEESEGRGHTHTHGACGVRKATSRCHLWFSVTSRLLVYQPVWAPRVLSTNTPDWIQKRKITAEIIEWLHLQFIFRQTCVFLNATFEGQVGKEKSQIRSSSISQLFLLDRN